jgi:hypothetical protein
LVKLFRGVGSSAIGEEVQEQLGEGTQRSLRADPRAIVTKDSIMQELGIKLSEWVKEGSRLADKNIEMHGAITGNLHPRVRQELAKMQEHAEIEENSDGLALGRLVTKLLSVASTKHPNIAKSEADNYYYRFLKHAKGEDVHYYKTNFDEALMRRKAAGLDDISQADQARHFIDNLDMDRYGEAVADLHNDAARDASLFPITLEAAYEWAHKKVIFKSRQPQNNNGAQFTSLAATTDAKSDGKKTDGVKDLSHILCHKCGKKGHYANRCNAKKNKPEDSGTTTTAAVTKEDASSNKPSAKKDKKQRKKKNKKAADDQGEFLASAAVNEELFFTFASIVVDDSEIGDDPPALRRTLSNRAMLKMVMTNILLLTAMTMSHQRLCEYQTVIVMMMSTTTIYRYLDLFVFISLTPLQQLQQLLLLES